MPVSKQVNRFETQPKMSGTCSPGDFGKGRELPSKIDVASKEVVNMIKWYGLSKEVLNSQSAMLCAVPMVNDLVLEDAFTPKGVEGGLDNESVSCFRKGTNQLEHDASVLRGKAIDANYSTGGSSTSGPIVCANTTYSRRVCT